MCLVFCSYQPASPQSLVLVANRDEYHVRPTLPLHQWKETAGIYAGKDVTGQGTWLGINAKGRVAVLTNCRIPRLLPTRAGSSRGTILINYLRGSTAAIPFLEELSATSHEYAGFSLLLLDEVGLYYYHSPSQHKQLLSAGVYGLSNAYLDTPWAKLHEGKNMFATQIKKNIADDSAFFALMEDTRTAPDHLLPQTGLAYEAEKAYSSRCIRTPAYGTRCTTLVRKYAQKMCIREKTHALPHQKAGFQHYTLRF